MPENRPTKIAWKTKGYGEVRRRRPRKLWNGEILEILRRRNTTWDEAQQLTSNREQLEEFCEEPRSRLVILLRKRRTLISVPFHGLTIFMYELKQKKRYFLHYSKKVYDFER